MAVVVLRIWTSDLFRHVSWWWLVAGELLCRLELWTESSVYVTGDSLVPRPFGSPVLRLWEQVLARRQEASLQVSPQGYWATEAQTVSHHPCHRPLLSVLLRLKETFLCLSSLLFCSEFLISRYIQTVSRFSWRMMGFTSSPHLSCVSADQSSKSDLLFRIKGQIEPLCLNCTWKNQKCAEWDSFVSICLIQLVVFPLVLSFTHIQVGLILDV